MVKIRKLQVFGFLGLVFFLGVFVYILLVYPFYEGDTYALLTGVSAIHICLNEGVFFKCPNVVHFPLFQYIPALIFSELGLSQQTILRILSLLSSISFVGLLFLSYFVMKKVTKPWMAITAVLIMISSPFFHYARSSLNEMTAAFITLAFTSAVILRSPTWVVAVLIFLAGITKETALPFLVLIGVLALFPEIFRYPAQSKRQVIGIAYGAFLSIIFNVAFNYFRFGTPHNITLLQDLFIVKSTAQRLSSFLGIWLSPNGGILFFWFSLFVYLFFVFPTILKSLPQRINLNIHNIPALTILLILFLLTLGFSSWWSPFGWWCWGPRLMLPWLPSLLLLTLYFYQEETLILLKKLFLINKWSSLFSTLILFFMSLPHLAALLFPGVWLSFFNPDSTCPRIPYITEPDYYYYCLNHLMWTKFPPLTVQSLHVFLSNVFVFWLGVIYFFALYSLIYLIRLSRVKEQST